MSDPYGYDGSSVNPDAFKDKQTAPDYKTAVKWVKLLRELGTFESAVRYWLKRDGELKALLSDAERFEKEEKSNATR